jgi:hypothetical protein
MPAKINNVNAILPPRMGESPIDFHKQ